jgi:hypothetical protein
MGTHSLRRFLTSVGKPLRYPRISLIRCVREISDASRRRPIQWSHRVPLMLNGPRSPPRRQNRPAMLPGFRFLFAAIVLSMSMLVFGLGAAALLRAAHEEFASNPAWHSAVPEAMVAQQGEATRPVLAMLRVEPRPAEPKRSDNAPATGAVPAASAVPAIGAEPAAIASTPAEPEQIASPKLEQAAPAEAAKPDTPTTESPAQSEAAAAAPIGAPAAADETQTTTSTVDTNIVSTEPVVAGQAPPPPLEAPPATSAPAQSEPATREPATSQPAASERASSPASAEADVASTTIGTLGGPPVSVATPSPPNAATAPDKSELEKRQRARRAAQRRRAAARARAARLAPQPANPFAQPQPFNWPATAGR